MSDFNIKTQKAYMLVCLIEKYYETDAAGGCCHVILDNHNYGTDILKHCIEFSIEEKDFWGETISRLLMEFTEEEQEQIIERKHEIYNLFFQ